MTQPPQDPEAAVPPARLHQMAEPCMPHHGQHGAALTHLTAPSLPAPGGAHGRHPPAALVPGGGCAWQCWGGGDTGTWAQPSSLCPPSAACRASSSSCLEKNNFRQGGERRGREGRQREAAGPEGNTAGMQASTARHPPPTGTAAAPSHPGRPPHSSRPAPAALRSSGTQRAGPEQWSRPTPPRRRARPAASTSTHNTQRLGWVRSAPGGSSGTPCAGAGTRGNHNPIALPFPYEMPSPLPAAPRLTPARVGSAAFWRVGCPELRPARPRGENGTGDLRCPPRGGSCCTDTPGARGGRGTPGLCKDKRSASPSLISTHPSS